LECENENRKKLDAQILEIYKKERKTALDAQKKAMK